MSVESEPLELTDHLQSQSRYSKTREQPRRICISITARDEQLRQPQNKEVQSMLVLIFLLMTCACLTFKFSLFVYPSSKINSTKINTRNPKPYHPLIPPQNPHPPLPLSKTSNTQTASTFPPRRNVIVELTCQRANRSSHSRAQVPQCRLLHRHCSHQKSRTSTHLAEQPLIISQWQWKSFFMQFSVNAKRVNNHYHTTDLHSSQNG